MSPDCSKARSSKAGSMALETEPFVFFHPTLAGTSPPGSVQPVDKPPLLEEEPVTWPRVVVRSAD